MRRFLICLVSLMVVLALMAPCCLADPKAYDYWVVATEPCDTRVEPELNAGVNGMMERGDEMIYAYDIVVDYKGTVWYRVDTGYSTSWADANSVVLMGQSGVICEGYRFDVDNHARLIRATGGDTNIRELPNKDTGSLGVLKLGQAAIFTGLCYTDTRDMSWFCVEFEDDSGEGRTGWVSYKYTSME